MKRVLRTLLILTVLAVNIGCDQISKRAVRRNIEYNEQITVVKNFVTLTKVENTGAFLSAGGTLPQPLKVIVLMILPAIALLVALVYVIRKHSLSIQATTAIGFMLAGGVGNIYDRLRYGSVTDFLHIDFGIFQTGIFNMADVSIMTGAIMILIDAVTSKKTNSAPVEESESDNF